MDQRIQRQNFLDSNLNSQRQWSNYASFSRYPGYSSDKTLLRGRRLIFRWKRSGSASFLYGAGAVQRAKNFSTPYAVLCDVRYTVHLTTCRFTQHTNLPTTPKKVVIDFRAVAEAHYFLSFVHEKWARRAPWTERRIERSLCTM
jgi:hypothetical protein